MEIFKFELNYHRKQNLVYILFGVFFLLAFLATTTPNVQFVSGVDNLNINASYTILSSLSSLVLIALFGSVAFSANAVIRDFELGTAELFFTRPISKLGYVYGRFFGSLFYAYVVYAGALLGLMLGELMPWIDQNRIGEFSLHAYFYTTWVIALPNLFTFSAIVFCIATVTRSMMASYMGVVVLLMLSFLLDTFTEKSTVELTSILDPFGTTAIEQVTRYWTVFEKNNLLPAVEGALLSNRLFWIFVGIVFLIAAYLLFPFSLERSTRSRSSNSQSSKDQNELAIAASSRNIEKNRTKISLGIVQKFDFNAHLLQCWSQTKLEVKNIVQSPTFSIVLLLGLFLVVASAIGNLGDIFGTSVYPSTAILIQIINGAFSLSLLVVLIFYSGELMVRERAVKVAEIMDAMPFPNWVMIVAKIIGLFLVIVCMLLAAMIAAIGVQLYSGFTDIDLKQYLVGLLFFFQFPFYFMVVLAVFFFVVSRSKYVSMFLMVLYFVLSLALPALGYEHYLYRMRELPAIYSDFTGYSHNLVPYLWQTLYWSVFGGLLLIVIHLLWPRGTEDDWLNRLRVLRQRVTKPVLVSLWLLTTLWVSLGSYIYYNTNILNEYITNDDVEEFQVRYEKLYKQYQYQSMPNIDNVYANVNIFPSEQALQLTGSYEMENETDAPISEIYFTILQGVHLKLLDVPGAIRSNPEAKQFHIYHFLKPLAPNQRLKVKFEVQWLTPGFANNGHNVGLTQNGTFVNSTQFFPQLGYQNSLELQDNNKRRGFDLPPLERMAKIDDERGLMRTPLNTTRVNFETVVSTDNDQIAIAPGYLQRKWVENGRRFFHYKMDTPIWDFYAFMSGRYQVQRDKWGDIAIEVYYHHEYNVDRMIAATKTALAYFTENFSPYQYRQFRIIEFPAYQGRFAQSFPNTIPFSEAIGFQADVRDKQKIDYVYYVTAHELAHQWWAHQVMGADVQGSAMIVETLAQYSALMVMKQVYGEASMQKFLGFELDRYLRDRGGERIDEMPLYLVEDQPYIHYRKGSVALYALQDYLGETLVNKVLAEFIKTYAFKGAPYPTTKDLIAILRAHAPEQYESLITDLFEKIVLYDLKAKTASVKQLENGRFEVTLAVSAKKIEADGKGLESVVAINDWVDIGILGALDRDSGVPEILYLQKHKLDNAQSTIRIVVDKLPVSAGIDPLNKLIDRNPKDNVVEIE